jgi:hypothetical protein
MEESTAVEMEESRNNEREEEQDGLVSKRKGDSKARVAYRAEVAKQRGFLLAVMIIPVVLIVVLWLFYDSNSQLGPHKSRAQDLGGGDAQP